MTQAAVPAPSVRLTSFACPHCGAHAAQHWYKLRAERITGESPTPPIYSEEQARTVEVELERARERGDKESELLETLLTFVNRAWQGEPFLDEENKADSYRLPDLCNVFVSRCYTCGRVALWLHDRVLYPATMAGAAPNADLPADAMRDYEEARTILDLSPRGAAALLRLAVEKICGHIGADGANINEMIADLVAKGLPQEVQEALDAVRVIGNEAVHPGQLDLRDDRDTAMSLFGLVNFIAEDRITRPKQRSAIYNMIPEGKRKAIEERNAKALDKAK